MADNKTGVSLFEEQLCDRKRPKTTGVLTIVIRLPGIASATLQERVIACVPFWGLDALLPSSVNHFNGSYGPRSVGHPLAPAKGHQRRT
nr:unnamed protein product [Spirometra erinaceieuropaei]